MDGRKVVRVAQRLGIIAATVVACCLPVRASQEHKSVGIAVAVGLNSVDPTHYGGWSGTLEGCEPDARDMTKIAEAQRLRTVTLLTREATRAAVRRAIASAALELKTGDLFVLSFSVHGSQVPDRNGDEPDGLDETLCLYDGQLIDDELYAALGQFAKGVRVLVFSDSCTSGTIIQLKPEDFSGKDLPAERAAELARATDASKAKSHNSVKDVAAEAANLRAMPPLVAIRTYAANRDFYDELGSATEREDKVAMRAAVISITACEDGASAMDIGTNGLFTATLKKVWAGGVFNGSHPEFHRRIREMVSSTYPPQVPHYFTLNSNAAFERQRPYTITPPTP